MRRCKRSAIQLWCMLVLMCAVSINSSLQAQNPAPNTPKVKNRQVKYFYVNGLAALGFDIYKSSDIEKLLEEDFDIQSVGFPFQYGIRAGYRHIAQFEYHVSTSKSHNIGTVTGYVNGQWVGESVSMKLKAKDMLFKVNPFFWGWSQQEALKPSKCMFFIVGTGDVEYKDKINEGFEGSGMIYGLEYAAIAKYATFSFGMTFQQITYDKARLFGTNFNADLKASRFILFTSLGLGYGI